MYKKIIRLIRGKKVLEVLFSKPIHYFAITILANHNLFNRINYKLKYGLLKKIDNPVTFSQKLLFMKNAYKNVVLATTVSDKVKVRDFVIQRIGKDTLNEVYQICKNPLDIDYKKLPSSFIIKTNNACGTNIIVNDKSCMNSEIVGNQLSSWLKTNYSNLFGEMQYYKIEPTILIERLLKDKNGFEEIIDYQFWCFNGKVKFINSHRYFYNEQGEKRICRLFYSSDFDFIFKDNNTYNGPQLKKPESLAKMVEFSKTLSRGFPFVRIDFYDGEENPVFGEMTLTPTSGDNYYFDEKLQESLGDLIDLRLLDTMDKKYEEHLF